MQWKLWARDADIKKRGWGFPNSDHTGQIGTN